MLGSIFIGTATGWAESGQRPTVESNVVEIAHCQSRIAESNEAGVDGYDITVSPRLLKIAALRSDDTIDDPLIQPLKEVHWATKPSGQLVHSCFEENTNHDTLQIQVFEDVVIVQQTSLAGLHGPQVFKILRPILNPEPHSRLNGTGSETFHDSKSEFQFEKKVRYNIEYGEPFSPELLASLKDQVKLLAQSQCRPIGAAQQIGDFRTHSRHQPYMGEFIEVTGRFICIDDDESDKFHVRANVSAWNADSGRLFEAAYERMIIKADAICNGEDETAKIITAPIYGGDNFSVATVSAWFICVESTIQ